ncbi:MAG: DUF3822 family protein [Bacteroidia bacterium]|nr:DUF3822 family protein [Bacteroidia bacterium]
MIHELNLTDPTWDSAAAGRCDLSVQIASGSISCCLLDNLSNKFISLFHTNFDDDVYCQQEHINKLADIFRNDPGFTGSFRKTRIIYVTSFSTLIPEPLFEEDKAVRYFHFNHEPEEDNEILFNRLRYTEAYLVFRIPDLLRTTIENQFPGAGIFHQAGVFAENLLLSASAEKFNGEALSVHVNVNSDHFDIAVTNHSSLRLLNNFRFRNENDFCYFILYVYDQLKLDPEKVPAVFSGLIGEDSSSLLLLGKYIKNLSFARPGNFFSYYPDIEIAASHHFLQLFNINRCEL